MSCLNRWYVSETCRVYFLNGIEALPDVYAMLFLKPDSEHLGLNIKNYFLKNPYLFYLNYLKFLSIGQEGKEEVCDRAANDLGYQDEVHECEGFLEDIFRSDTQFKRLKELDFETKVRHEK